MIMDTVNSHRHGEYSYPRRAGKIFATVFCCSRLNLSKMCFISEAVVGLVHIYDSGNMPTGDAPGKKTKHTNFCSLPPSLTRKYLPKRFLVRVVMCTKVTQTSKLLYKHHTWYSFCVS